MLIIAIVVIGPVPVPSVAHAAVLPELPRVYLDTTFTLPTGPTITVPAGGDFQGALNAAQPGSSIVLAAGATYAGNFTLPNKSGTGWIYIQSSALSSLPAPGTRVTPAQAALMPRILDTSGNPTIRMASGAHNYRLVGLEVTTTWATTSGTNVTLLSADGSTNLVIDRCYIHGTPTGNIRNGVTINSTATAIIDSYLADIHEVNNEAHAILGQNGPGPFKIVNNEIQASGENLMFTEGGSLTPADIEIRGNHLFKPLSWLPGNPAFAGISWAVKNTFELKNAARVLVDGNVFENNWVGVFQPQDGFCIAFTVRGTNNPSAVVRDVTFTHNIVQHCSAGVQFLGWDYNATSQEQQRLLIQNNLFLDIGAHPMIYDAGRLFQMSDGGADYVIDHNTAFNIEDPIYAQDHNASNWPATGFVFTNNIVASNAGVCGDRTGSNTMSTLNTYFSGYVFDRNAMTGGNSANYPATNYFPASFTQVGFVNLAGGDYHLAASSPYKNAGTDGKDLGADIDAVLAATVGAISGIDPPPATAPTLSVTPSTSVDFGAVAVGGSADRSFTVTNTGGGTLTGTASSVVPFSVVSGSAFNLGAGTSQTVVARFSPTAAGTFANTATFSSNASTASPSVTGTGTAIPGPTLSVAPQTTVDFGVVTVGGSVDRSFTVTNSGGGTLTGTASIAAPFGVVSGGSFGLTAGTSQTVVVRFSPTVAGSFANSVGFNSNAGTAARSVTGASTAAVDTIPPVISSVTVSSVSSSGAAITWTTNEPADSQVEYGPTTSYGTSTPLTAGLVTAHAVTLSGLAGGTLYHYRVKSKDAAGNLATSADLTVTTVLAPDTTPPVISSVAASSITSSGATIMWTTDEAADSAVEYGVTMSYGSTTLLDTSLVTTHTVTLSSLTSGTLQHYRVKSKDAAGNQAPSGDFTFTTAQATTDPPPPQDPGTPPASTPSAQSSGTTSGGPGGAAPGGSGFASVGGGLAPSPALGGAASDPGAGVASAGTAGAPIPGPVTVWSGAVPAQTQGVVWSSLVNVTSTGGSLTKISGCDGCADAGAVSKQQITAGDGYFEFTASETGSLRLIGFRSSNRGADRNEIQFAIVLRPGGMAEVRELGIRRTNTTYVRGDVFRIAVVAGTIRYYKNGRLLYISGLAPAYPLTVGTSLLSRGATVTRAIISGRLSQGNALPADTVPLEASIYVSPEGSQESATVSLSASDSGHMSSVVLNGLCLDGLALPMTPGSSAFEISAGTS